MTKREFLARFSHTSQYAAAIPCILDSGKGTGMKAIRMYTGTGLDFTVFPSRGMDIGWATMNGKSIAYFSKTGPVHPRYYDASGAEWLRGFFGGLLTTCGLTYMGAPCVDQGVALGLHGRITHAEAEDIAVNQEWIGDELVISVKGKVTESRLFGENIALYRKISIIAGQNLINIEDTIENLGFKPEPLMVLYHFNYGFPLLSETAKLYVPSIKVNARDKDAEADNGIAEFNQFQPPTEDYKEKVFFIDLKSDIDGKTTIALINREHGIGIYEKFNVNELPKFIEWKMMGESEYVLGLEPGTAVPNGRKAVRESGDLMEIQPGEIKKFSIEIGVMTEEEEFKKMISEIESI